MVRIRPTRSASRPNARINKKSGQTPTSVLQPGSEIEIIACSSSRSGDPGQGAHDQIVIPASDNFHIDEVAGAIPRRVAVRKKGGGVDVRRLAGQPGLEDQVVVRGSPVHQNARALSNPAAVPDGHEFLL